MKPAFVATALFGAALIGLFVQEQRLREETRALRAEILRVPAAMAPPVAPPVAAQEPSHAVVVPSAPPPTVAAGRSEGPASSAPSPPPPPSPEDVRAFLDTSLASQREDPGWSRDAALDLRKDITTRLPEGSSLRALTCKAEICRAEIAQADEAAAQSFAQKSMDMWQGPIHVVSDHAGPNGGPTTVVYAFRPGSDPLATLR